MIVNRTTGNLVDGHLRVLLAEKAGEKAVPVTYVELSENEEKVVLSFLDPLSAMAVTDKEMLEQLLRDIEVDDERLKELIKELAIENKIMAAENYSRKIVVPIYEPKGMKPEIGELYDDSKYLALLKEIEGAEIPEEDKAFLREAATRHIKINYKMVAEYYSHAPEKVRELMEKNALVIIDFGKAVENGFVYLVEDVARLYEADYGDK